MSIYSKLHHVQCLIVVSLLLPLLCACSSDEGEGTSDGSGSDIYMSLTVVVGDGPGQAMRGEGDIWWPRGGEHGNGNEGGFIREGEVTGVTVVLFQTADLDGAEDSETDKTGLNADNNPVLDFIRYFPVTEKKETNQQETNNIEYEYPTERIPLGEHHLDFTKKYRMLAIANYRLEGLTEGVSKLNDLRDKVTNLFYKGDAIMGAHLCTNFVLTSENNQNAVDFSTLETQAVGTNGKNYHIGVIEVERMAARIDFWSWNGEYKTASASNGDYDAPGYVYRVWKETDDENPTSSDRFVVTHITPFNLYDDGEYLFKHVTVDGTLKYLAKEDGIRRFVIDPKTSDKSGAKYINKLSDITDDDDLLSNPYRHSVEDMHEQVTTNKGADGKTGGFQYQEIEYYNDIAGITASAEDIIVAYPMENCLKIHENLYNYATGIAIEGDYYSNDDPATKSHMVFYGFLRHNSMTIAPASYKAYTRDEFTEFQALENYSASDADNAMLFGVVRNNIYRVHIDKVKERGTLSYSIKVKKWDPFTHSTIYM